MHDPKPWLALLVFYSGYLVWIYLAWLGWRWRKARPAFGRHPYVALAWRLSAAGLFIWARFVEPQVIVDRETRTGLETGTRAILISDLHLGAYKGPAFIERLVERINVLKPDCVLIAGDTLYVPDASLDQLFAALKKVQAPVLAVLGNHDDRELGWRRGGDVESAEIASALTRAGVKVIENQVAPCGNVSVAGIGDLWSGRVDFSAARRYRGSAPLVLLTHNPDVAYRVPAGLSPLLLSGHTHGGQIRLPVVYRYVIPVKGPFDRGLLVPAQWNAEPAGRPAVFTTSGVGEIGLPMRLFNPPVIDLLRL
jgi:predicted MPP superfamily phosphohydrolase